MSNYYLIASINLTINTVTSPVKQKIYIILNFINFITMTIHHKLISKQIYEIFQYSITL